MRSRESTEQRPDLPAASAEGGFDCLLENVYDELRKIAHFHNLNERGNLTLQTTALVHEAYLRLAASDKASHPQDQHHLKALTSRIIRRLLVDQARQRKAQKRTAPEPGADIPGGDLIDPAFNVDLLDLDTALNTLADNAPRLARIIEMRFFGGFSAEQAASVLNLSSRTVERDWQKARAYLLQLLQPAGAAKEQAT